MAAVSLNELRQLLNQCLSRLPHASLPGRTITDYSVILQDPIANDFFNQIITEGISNINFDIFLAPESKGFLFGSLLAAHQKKGLVFASKQKIFNADYLSEQYTSAFSGQSALFLRGELIKAKRIVIVDDIIDSTNTVRALVRLATRSGAVVVGIVCLINYSRSKSIQGIPLIDACDGVGQSDNYLLHKNE